MIDHMMEELIFRPYKVFYIISLFPFFICSFRLDIIMARNVQGVSFMKDEAVLY